MIKYCSDNNNNIIII